MWETAGQMRFMRNKMSAGTHQTPQSIQSAKSEPVGAPEAVDADKRAMQIAAAQLRLVTDRRLGKTTPEWVRNLAAEKPRGG